MQRPYRSHKIRACDYCRKRKQRCHVAIIGETCQLCQLQGIECRYDGKEDGQTLAGVSSQATRRQFTAHSLKRPHSTLCGDNELDQERPRNNVLPMTHPRAPERSSDGASLDTGNHTAHIVGPFVARDAHVLEQYMTPASPRGQQSTNNPYKVYSADPNMPVLYTKVERRRKGLAMSEAPGLKQKQLLDQIMYPDTEKLLKVYV